MRALTPADDNFHTPTCDDLFWTETAWFAFAVPERRLTAHVYPVFRTNQRICSSAMYIWDDTGEATYNSLYSYNYCHLPLPADLTKMRLQSGLSYDVLEPLRKYHVRYDTDDVHLDLIYEGLFEPILSPKEDHLDQPCTVRGTLTLYGEEIAVNCCEMRDKSWHVRSDHPLKLPEDLAQGSYTYAIDRDVAFLARAFSSDPNRTKIYTGWLYRDGVASELKSGERTVVRKGGVNSEVVIDAVDALGRRLRATGTTINRFAYHSTPAILPWLRGTNWIIEGKKVWGEDQEWAAGSSRKSLQFN
jgi:hypothetical protein